MKESCTSCSACKTSLWIKLPLIALLGTIIFLASQNAFGEITVSIPNDAGDPSCAESGSCFLPSHVTVGIGNSVTWINDSAIIHTVTSGNSDDGPDGLFDSQIITSGNSFTYTFSETGQYQYFCSIHPWMQGTVLVE